MRHSLYVDPSSPRHYPDQQKTMPKITECLRWSWNLFIRNPNALVSHRLFSSSFICLFPGGMETSIFRPFVPASGGMTVERHWIDKHGVMPFTLSWCRALTFTCSLTICVPPDRVSVLPDLPRTLPRYRCLAASFHIR